MAEEQRVLDRSGAHAETAGVATERGQVLLPLDEGEALPAGVGGDGTQGEEELPGTDVEYAVAPWVDEREDGGGDGDADAGQTGQ